MENKITARAQKVLLAKVKNQSDVDRFFLQRVVPEVKQ